MRGESWNSLPRPLKPSRKGSSFAGFQRAHPSERFPPRKNGTKPSDNMKERHEAVRHTTSNRSHPRQSSAPKLPSLRLLYKRAHNCTLYTTTTKTATKQNNHNNNKGAPSAPQTIDDALHKVEGPPKLKPPSGCPPCRAATRSVPHPSNFTEGPSCQRQSN